MTRQRVKRPAYVFALYHWRGTASCRERVHGLYRIFSPAGSTSGKFYTQASTLFLITPNVSQGPSVHAGTSCYICPSRKHSAVAAHSCAYHRTGSTPLHALSGMFAPCAFSTTRQPKQEEPLPISPSFLCWLKLLVITWSLITLLLP